MRRVSKSRLAEGRALVEFGNSFLRDEGVVAPDLRIEPGKVRALAPVTNWKSDGTSAVERSRSCSGASTR